MNGKKIYNLILCHSLGNVKKLTIQILKYTALLNFKLMKIVFINYLVHYDN